MNLVFLHEFNYKYTKDCHTLQYNVTGLLYYDY